MSIPNTLRKALADEQNLEISQVQPVAGGSINRAAKLHTDQGVLFLKWNESADPDMFGKEVRGLRLLRNAETDLILPKVLSYNDQKGSSPGYLLMKFISSDGWENHQNAPAEFGKQLARLHQHSAKEFGLDHDNYIGLLPQSNQTHPSWTKFFIHERIEPQLKRALENDVLNSSSMQHWKNLAARLNELFPKASPSLLHGDLWSGNYFFNSEGKAVLIDPAVYYGHPEMELSFTRMFGGFSSAFYDAYQSVSTLEPGFKDRVPVYNLYPLLVHANLFGGHYARQVTSFLQRY
ncbi:MAG: fructosamine kinase family protein [Balneolaceae bacterium]